MALRKIKIKKHTLYIRFFFETFFYYLFFFFLRTRLLSLCTVCLSVFVCACVCVNFFCHKICTLMTICSVHLFSFRKYSAGNLMYACFFFFTFVIVLSLDCFILHFIVLGVCCCVFWCLKNINYGCFFFFLGLGF